MRIRKCNVQSCKKFPIWYAIGKRSNKINAQYCKEHYNNWAKLQKVCRRSNWIKIETE